MMNSHPQQQTLIGALPITGTDVAALLHISARIGRDPLLVQGSSGNTSMKIEGTLWVKASGKWLAFADREETFVPVAVLECLDCLKRDGPLPTCRSGNGETQLRPSIEALMHAALPQRVVIHVHCVATIACAVRADAPDCLAESLTGLNWHWIPYVASGLPLARA